MARVDASTMQNEISNLIRRRLTTLRVSKPKQVADDIAIDIMRDAIPAEAYDSRPSWEYGQIFFHSDIEDETVLPFQQELLGTHHNIKLSIPITLYLSSFGGEVFAGLSLASTIAEIRRSGRKVNAHIMGCAMSMGSLVAQACDVRTIEPTGYFMLHEIAWGSEYQKTSSHIDDVESWKKIEHMLFSLYSMRTGRPASYYHDKMHKKDWYLSAQEAVKEGLVDRIRPVPAFHNKRPSRTPSDAKATT